MAKAKKISAKTSGKTKSRKDTTATDGACPVPGVTVSYAARAEAAFQKLSPDTQHGITQLCAAINFVQAVGGFREARLLISESMEPVLSTMIDFVKAASAETLGE
jgi:hypothetical protein